MAHINITFSTFHVDLFFNLNSLCNLINVLIHI